MTKPDISIILPVYNVKNYLQEALDSAINQTLNNIEIICVDDCSTDGSLAILEEYANKDSRIKIIRQKQNMGEVVAKYTGAKIAKADYIATIDPDDWVQPKTYEVMLKKALEVDADVVVCNFHIIDEEGNLLNKWDVVDERMSKNDKYLDETNIIQINPATINKIIKKELYLNALNFTDRDVWKDMLQYWRCYTNKHCRAVFITDHFYMYRIRHDSITNTPISCKLHFKYFCKTIDLRLKYLLENNSYTRYKSVFWKPVFRWKDCFEKAYNVKEIIKIAKKYKIDKKDYSILLKNEDNNIQTIFSLKNKYSNNKKYKVLTIFGTKIKFKISKKRKRKQKGGKNPE